MNKWWGYLHENGSIQVKPWHGDHGDYTTDCQDNPFVKQVVEPFEAPSYGDAVTYVRSCLLLPFSG
jgi:hypothetical protein